jgi:hypothetical protein
VTSRADAALLAAVLPLAAATLLAQRKTQRSDPAVVVWQAMPLRVRCLLERGAPAWLSDRIETLVRDLALQHASDEVSEANSLEAIMDAIWDLLVASHPEGMSRDKNQYHAERYIALLDGTHPCPHDDDREHAEPSTLWAPFWQSFCERNVVVTYR